MKDLKKQLAKYIHEAALQLFWNNLLVFFFFYCELTTDTSTNN